MEKMITKNWQDYIHSRLEDMLDRVDSLLKLVPANGEDEFWALQNLRSSIVIAIREFKQPARH